MAAANKSRKKAADMSQESSAAGKKPSKAVVISVAAIIALAVITGITATLVSKNKPSAKTTNDENGLTIIDPVTGKKYTMPIEPASASMDHSPAPTLNASAIPSGNSSAKKDFSYLFKKAESKTAIAQITLEEAKYLFDSNKAVFIDSRGDNQYNELHIKGAISIPAGAEPSVIERNSQKLKSAKVAVTYCHGVGCHLADKTAYLLFDSGYTNVVIFFGGWNQWTQANYPVSK